MHSNPHLLAPRVLALSWLAAAMAFPLTLLTAVIGQGVGAVAGSCGWIGLSVPVERQVWALVNQPVLNFASLPSATGYWLGSLVLPLTVGALLVPFWPRARSLTAELVVVQTAWAASAVGVAWLPLLDPQDGHLARWLVLHELPAAALWIAPVVGAGLAVPPSLRLLELARRYRHHAGRAYRLSVVGTHLVVPLVAWAALAITLRGSFIVFATIGVALVAVASLALAWFRYPTPFAHVLREPSSGDVLALAGAAVILAACLWFGGRPLADGKTAGLLWGSPTAFNNVRPWIESVAAIHSPS